MQKLVVSLSGLIVAASWLFAADKQIDVSQIIDQATAESVLDTKVKTATPRNFRGSDGYYSKCNYYGLTPGKTLVLRLYQAADGYDPLEQLNVITKSTPALIEILGLGDKAFATDGTASGLSNSAVMLYILKGNSLITIGLSGVEDKTAALEKAKGVAARIVGQL